MATGLVLPEKDMVIDTDTLFKFLQYYENHHVLYPLYFETKKLVFGLNRFLD